MNPEKSKTTVYLSDRAIADLLEVESYSLEHWSKKTTERYLNSFEKFLALIETYPDLLTPIPAINDLWTHSVGSHIVVCTKWKQVVLILTVIHASRDLVAHLDELLPSLRREVETLRLRIKGNNLK